MAARHVGENAHSSFPNKGHNENLVSSLLQHIFMALRSLSDVDVDRAIECRKSKTKAITSGQSQQTHNILNL